MSRRRLLAAAAAIVLAVPSAVADARTREGYEKCVENPAGWSVVCESLESCEPSEVWVLGKRAWRRPDGPTRAEWRRYRHLLRCVSDRERARRKWRHARERFER